MHDTAYQIGGLVMDTYLPLLPARILEIGAMNVNGTLRDHSPRNAEYIGLDFEGGDGVDAVVSSCDDWDVLYAHFDLVMASSVFEHDKTFWRTFLQMCRKAKPGGHIYINAPSNGTVHRYPKDYWRFYPDSGLALEEWARSEGLELTLVESFIAEREGDGWNDFCAVFRRGPGDAELNRDFVHNKVRCTNALNWRSSRIINPIDDPEDVRLLRAARQEAVMASEEEARMRVLYAKQISDLSREIEEKNSELERLNGKVKTQEDQAKQQSRRLEEAEAELESEKARKSALEYSLSAELKEIRAQKSISDQRLQERFREIAGLTQLIQERDQAIGSAQSQIEWLRQVVSVLTKGFSASPKARLIAWLPTYFSHKRQKTLLKEQRLFDPESYTSIYPDVAKSKTDPLRHYINHGLKEGRTIKQGA